MLRQHLYQRLQVVCKKALLSYLNFKSSSMRKLEPLHILQGGWDWDSPRSPLRRRRRDPPRHCLLLLIRRDLHLILLGTNIKQIVILMIPIFYKQGYQKNACEIDRLILSQDTFGIRKLSLIMKLQMSDTFQYL